jgi:Fuc2NAc and GlcNAc transferase
MQDVPNERSSHAVPTPRGGGAAIVIVTSAAWAAGLVVADARGWLGSLLLGGVIIAVTGWLDDVRGLRARTRILLHFSAAALGLVLVAGTLVIRLPFDLAIVGYGAAALGLFHIVWGINSFNFMDGIDGIAAGQAATVCAVLAPLAEHGGNRGLALACLAVAASSAGFLLLNWQPAMIFMGDVCSGFLGFFLAAVALWGEASGAVPLPTTLILMGVFVVDATYTLFRRLLAGERVYQAHRDHAYQHANQRGSSHARVSGTVILINLLWLAPLGVLAAARPMWSWPLLALAYAPLLAAAIYFRAGQRPDPVA